jgi:S1-C subfamily serine protease
MTGDWLDVVLVLSVVAFAFSGYRQGFLVGVLAFVGFLGGAVVGAKIAPSLIRGLHSQSSRALVGIVIVFVGASIGQVAASWVGAMIRKRLTWTPIRLVDSVGGAVVSAVSVLLVAWLVGTALASSPSETISKEIHHSWVLQKVDKVIPTSVRDLFSTFRRLVAQQGFPPVFGGLGPTRIVNVPPPDPAVLNSPAVRRDRPVIVKIQGNARCSKSIEGSGFLYASEHVMTNAHVVAGVRSPQVITDSGKSYDARVVLYDPKRDIAVLDVPGFPGRPLAFAGPAREGASAVVAGYPQNGPFMAVAARIRSTEQATGPDIYQRGAVTRQIYSLRGTVRPGNSGGPLLAPSGDVYGVIFARAADRSDTGFALTAAEVASDARAGANATQAVSTQGCTSE